MTLEDRLTYCRCCENSQYDLQEGIKCGLTGRKPEFESTCPDYLEDYKKRAKFEKSIFSRISFLNSDDRHSWSNKVHEPETYKSIIITDRNWKSAFVYFIPVIYFIYGVITGDISSDLNNTNTQLFIALILVNCTVFYFTHVRVQKLFVLNEKEIQLREKVMRPIKWESITGVFIERIGRDNFRLKIYVLGQEEPILSKSIWQMSVSRPKLLGYINFFRVKESTLKD